MCIGIDRRSSDFQYGQQKAMTSIQSFTMAPALEPLGSQAMSLPPFSFANLSAKETLQDLAVRFVLNCPEEDKSAAYRIMFQIEEAYWFYEDFVREQNPDLEPVKLPRFTQILYDAVPELSRYCKDFQTALAEFKQYKRSIPVRGVIVLNEGLDKVLMVRPYKRPVWGFPRGKINKEEDDRVCAVREVLEETGFDATAYLDGDNYVEREVQGKNFRFYYASGVPESTIFETRTRKEIDEIAWIPLSELRSNSARSRFVITLMFLSSIDKFVRKKKNYLTRLSKAESRALKRLLAVPEPSSVRNDEDSAKQLLGMLKPAEHQTRLGEAEDPQPQLQPQQPTTQQQQQHAQQQHAQQQQQQQQAALPTAEQDRQVLLNLLKESTPQLEAAPNAANNADAVQNAEVESAKQILALLKKEMTASKKVNAPHVIPPNSESPAVPIASRPVLPPNSMLEQLVSSRKKTPVHKVSSAPKHKPVLSQNRFLNVLNSVPAPPVRETKLIDLLNPPTTSAPASSSPVKAQSESNPLMDLLKSESSAPTAELSSAPAPATEPPAAAESNPLMDLLKGGSDNVNPPAAAATEEKEQKPNNKEPSLLAMLQPNTTKQAEPEPVKTVEPQQRQGQTKQPKQQQSKQQPKQAKPQAKELKSSKQQAATNDSEEHELQLPSSVARLREISMKKEEPRVLAPSERMSDEALLKLLSTPESEIKGKLKKQQPKEEVLQNAPEDLMQLLRPSTPQTSYQEKANAAAIASAEGLLRLLESVPAPKPASQAPPPPPPPPSAAAAASDAAAEQLSKENTASNELMNLLKSEPQNLETLEAKTESTNELMNILKIGDSQNSASKASPTQQYKQDQNSSGGAATHASIKTPTQESTSGSNELMNLLNPFDKRPQNESDDTNALMQLLKPAEVPSSSGTAKDQPTEKESASAAPFKNNKLKHSEKTLRKSVSPTDQLSYASATNNAKNKPKGAKFTAKKVKAQDELSGSEKSSSKTSKMKESQHKGGSNKKEKAAYSHGQAKNGDARDADSRDAETHVGVTGGTLAGLEEVNTPGSTRSQTPIDNTVMSASSNPLLNLLQESFSPEQAATPSQPRPRADSKEKRSSFSLLNLLGLKSHSERTMPVVPKSP